LENYKPLVVEETVIEDLDEGYSQEKAWNDPSVTQSVFIEVEEEEFSPSKEGKPFSMTQTNIFEFAKPNDSSPSNWKSIEIKPRPKPWSSERKSSRHSSAWKIQVKHSSKKTPGSTFFDR